MSDGLRVTFRCFTFLDAYTHAILRHVHRGS